MTLKFEPAGLCEVFNSFRLLSLVCYHSLTFRLLLPNRKVATPNPLLDLGPDSISLKSAPKPQPETIGSISAPTSRIGNFPQTPRTLWFDLTSVSPSEGSAP